MHPSRILFWCALSFLAGVWIFFYFTKPSRTEFLQKKEQNRIEREARFGKLYEIRDWFLSSINHVVAQPVGVLVGGVLVGARSQMPKDINEDFRRTGLSHITAVSGYNTSIITVGLMNILVWFLPRRRAFWLVVVILGVFSILTGLQASVIRASIMGLFALFAQHMGRLPTPFHAMVIAAAIMVALNPAILVFDIGFQLSILATFGLLVLSPKLENRFPQHKRLGIFGETAIMTISAQIFVLPLIIYYFKTVSLISLPVNIIILPFIPLLMFFGFIAGLTGWIPIVGGVAGFFAWSLGKLILVVIHWFAAISWASITI